WSSRPGCVTCFIGGTSRFPRAPSTDPLHGRALRAGALSAYSCAMAGVLLRPGEGESLFGGRIVLKATFEQLCITESHFPDARDGADPHFHRRHADSFYVLEGGLAVLVHDEEKQLEPGAFVCAPPAVVHGFR